MSADANAAIATALRAHQASLEESATSLNGIEPLLEVCRSAVMGLSAMREKKMEWMSEFIGAFNARITHWESQDDAIRTAMNPLMQNQPAYRDFIDMITETASILLLQESTRMGSVLDNQFADVRYRIQEANRLGSEILVGMGNQITAIQSRSAGMAVLAAGGLTRVTPADAKKKWKESRTAVAAARKVHCVYSTTRNR